MIEDKRKVSTDALETLGTIISETEKRDAIHLAVEPMVAKETLWPSQHVNADGKHVFLIKNINRNDCPAEAVGIVDPFLKEPVEQGQRFWLVLYPRTIKSLRHVWEHPAFPPSELQTLPEAAEKESEVEKSKKWIQDFVIECQEYENEIDYDYIKKESLTYNNIMRFADEWVDSNQTYPEYFYVSESLRNKGLPQEFWDHYEIVTGKKVEEKKKENFFTCSC